MVVDAGSRIGPAGSVRGDVPGDLDRHELHALGRSLRKETPRASHASWEPPSDRFDPVALLEESNASRVPDLVPVRYGRMLDSAFTYLRGSPIVMNADFARTPMSGISVQCCGDAHLMNFGLYGSPERHVVFDLNDFDETLPGPWEWDLKRLAVSIVVGGKAVGMTPANVAQATSEAVRMYRTSMAQLETMSPLDVWYAHLDTETIQAQAVNAANRRATARAAEKARHRDSMQELQKLTTVVDGKRVIVEDPPLVVRDPLTPDLAEQIRAAFGAYLDTMEPARRDLVTRYRFVDFARKVVGVGSVGTRCWIMLGASPIDGSPLFLQIKEAVASVLEPHVPPTVYANQGERVVNGQRLLQAVSDIFLGWTRANEHDFYVRQLRDMKGGIDLARTSAAELTGYARLCGAMLARAHARTCPAPLIAGYLGTSDAFDRAVCTFATAYAAQNDRDYAALEEAERSGRITAVRGR
jgi:uncharacterized protein (DUF2252 family)